MRRPTFYFWVRMFTFHLWTTHLPTVNATVLIQVIVFVLWLSFSGPLTGTCCRQMFHRLALCLFLIVRLSRWAHPFRWTAPLFLLLFRFFLALFGLFVVPACFAIIRAFPVFFMFLGAPVPAVLASFLLSARASRLLPHFSMTVSASTVSLFTPVLVFVSTPFSLPVWLSVSASAPRSVPATARIPVIPSVSASGSGWPFVPPFPTPASPPVAISSAVRSLGSRRAPAAVTLSPWAVSVSLWMATVSVTSPEAPVWRQVQVPVCLPEFISRVSKYVQEITMLPFGALLSVKQSWEGEKKTRWRRLRPCWGLFSCSTVTQWTWPHTTVNK